MHLYFSDIDVVTFYDFYIRFRNCSDSVVFFFHLLLHTKVDIEISVGGEFL